MKSDLKVKYLQYLNNKKSDKGFTLIELLVVIIIIGILSAIALPAFLNQANKAKQSEAKTYVGSTNRGQQAYYAEKNGFVSSIVNFGDLGLGVSTDTPNYSYALVHATGGTGEGVTNQAIPKAVALKAYIGGVKIGQVAGTGEATTLATLCEAEDPSGSGPKGTETFTGLNTLDQNPPDCTTAGAYEQLQ